MRAGGHIEQTEREAKLSAEADFEVPNLGDLIPGLVAVAGPDRELHATYFDTGDLRLARRGSRCAVASATATRAAVSGR